MSDGRVDRSYLAVRNKAILEHLQRGASFELIAQHFGLSRAAIKRIAFNVRTIPNADIRYLAANRAKSYSDFSA